MTSTRRLAMKILIALERVNDTKALQVGLESLHHRVLICSDPVSAAEWLGKWTPDVLVTDERAGKGDRNSGLRLAEFCRISTETGPRCFRTQALILIPCADWDRMKHAQRTGAHVIVKGTNFDAVVRYIQAVADKLTTDQILGPILFGIHRFRGRTPEGSCNDCEWIGAAVSYGTSRADFDLPPVRVCLLNVLLSCRLGMSAATIVGVANDHFFLSSLLKGRLLRESAVKMEVTRLRRDITEALDRIGAPYQGNHFLPLVSYGIAKYRLNGSWQLSHLPRFPSTS